MGDTRALQGVLESCTLVKTYGNFRCPRVHPKSHARHICIFTYIYNYFHSLYTNIMACIHFTIVVYSLYFYIHTHTPITFHPGIGTKLDLCYISLELIPFTFLFL